ncbi:DEAD/DEAH box helicase [Actinopolyspora mortivallis]|uniref:RNA helicase n=1 Tax=Actinopolyspora mortivallis TaxID=33906 RepID=A0A2T0H0F0_ACTMO|nr:DEAD/DEAH box helicase [Actinopolyspora mortivallis]PRW64810.1 DEAD/DEAH box helicase [Actinopolyspora mortivallis]
MILTNNDNHGPDHTGVEETDQSTRQRQDTATGASPAEGGSSPTFAELGASEEIVRALRESGIEHTFTIQEMTLPLALRGLDLIGQARTGMGKTLGFGVPLLQRMNLPGDGTPQALVVVPTRELCLQVTKDLENAARYLGVRILSVYGGRPYEPQIEGLRAGVDVVIGTPGRLLDLADQRHLVLGKLSTLVLDEADEMLDLGFLPDIERILGMVPEQRQTMLFSATMPDAIVKLARDFLNHPTQIRAEQADESAVHERTHQFVYRAHAMDKPELLARVLQANGRGLTMIFSRTKRSAQKLADELTERGFAAGAVHGDLGQSARERALRAFRTGKIDVLVATDVAARGIDVEGVTHVINLQCPEDEKTYVHRIGRTGRAGRTGVAVTLVDWDEETRWKVISKELSLGLDEPVETYSTSAHLFSDLDIPADAGGRLPLSRRKRTGLESEREEGADSSRERRHRPRKKNSRGDGPSGRSSHTEDAGSRPNGRRKRRRTRGGKPVEQTQHSPSTTGSGQHDQGGASTRRRRTRRRRGGAGEQRSEETASTAGQ